MSDVELPTLSQALTQALIEPRSVDIISPQHTVALLSENAAENWAVASWHWAEHMDGPIPAEDVAWMGITGDHWSSRYWANQALIILAEAEDWAGQAEASAIAAAQSAAEAAASAALAEEFADYYLGAFALPPTVDNQGQPLRVGALYFDTAVVQMRAWNGTVWQGFETLGDTAYDVIFAPAAGISATNVQAAIVEALTDSKAYTDSVTGALTTGLANTYNKTDSDTRYVNSAGDTMTGALNINYFQPVLNLNKTASGQHNLIHGSLNGVSRWLISAGNTEAEGGGNAGSNFAIYNYDDAGTFLGAPLQINRATGSATFASIPICAVAPTLGHHLANHAYVEQRGNEWGAYHAGLRVLKTGDTMTGKLTVTAPSDISGAGLSAIEIQNVGSCAIGFHRPGSYGLQLGLYTDNTFYLGGWSQGGNRWSSDTAGNFTATGNVTAYSDARRKKDVATITQALALVKRMRGVRYTRTDTIERGVGVIAQEIQEVLPEVVHQESGGDKFLSVAYGNICGVLIEAIKELTKRVEELENRT